MTRQVRHTTSAEETTNSWLMQLSIDGDKYEIYDIDTEGNVDTIETGNVDDL